jgi:DNA mismatch repair protein MutL
MARIKILPPETARLIAAGEVIDRPAAALRELLDNALDSEASEIEVRVENGGIALLSVTDDGLGMDRDDLFMSILPHATSKISSADDLLTARTLGFRGEALASIATAARLEIVSKDAESPAAARLLAGPGVETSIQPVAGRRGTSVTVSNIFERYPARRQFLKRPQSEAALCRQVFADKALAHPQVLFRWISGSSRETSMPQSISRRICDFHPEIPFALTHELKFSGSGFAGEIVLCGPSFHRTDKRLLQIFVNRRRVQDWGLAGAVEHAYSGYLPGGMKPCAFVFAEVDPALADFNIHPAKREVRFKNPDDIRRAIISVIQSFLGTLARLRPEEVGLQSYPELDLKSFTPGTWQPGTSLGAASARIDEVRGFESRNANYGESFSEKALLREGPDQEYRSASPAMGGSFRYLGQVLGPFLVFEMGDSLYILDQHAAHERILYDKLRSGAVEIQRLLVPLELESEDEAGDARIEAMLPELHDAGFGLLRSESGWTLGSVPAMLGEKAFGMLAEIVANGTGEAFRGVRATIACHAAVKDGELLDRNAAEELIGMALGLPDPRCPHGRPVWTRLSREQLYRLVGRIVQSS